MRGGLDGDRRNDIGGREQFYPAAGIQQRQVAKMTDRAVVPGLAAVKGLDSGRGGRDREDRDNRDRDDQPKGIRALWLASRWHFVPYH